MQAQVVHETRYDYVPAVEVAQHMAYLQPLTTRTQRLLSHTLEVYPPPAQQTPAVDIYGNTRTFIALQAAHARLVSRTRPRLFMTRSDRRPLARVRG